MKKQKTKQGKVNPEIGILKNQLARTLADYDNLRKRTEEERLSWIKFATQKFILNLLPVLDNFEAAQVHLKDAGLAIAIGQFKDLLKEEGLYEIKPKTGDVFDENLMEAIEVVDLPVGSDDGVTTGKIAEVLVPGWRFNEGEVIRHAKVKVYKKEKSS